MGLAILFRGSIGKLESPLSRRHWRLLPASRKSQPPAARTFRQSSATTKRRDAVCSGGGRISASDLMVLPLCGRLSYEQNGPTAFFAGRRRVGFGDGGAWL